MKFAKVLTGIVASAAVAFTAATPSFAGTATGTQSSDIELSGCLIPGWADGATFDSEIAIDLDSSLGDLVLLGGNQYQFDFEAGVANQQMIDPNCIANDLVDIHYDVTYTLTNETHMSVSGNLTNVELTAGEVTNGVDLSFLIDVDPNLAVIDDFNATVIVDIDATLTFTETPGAFDVTD